MCRDFVPDIYYGRQVKSARVQTVEHSDPRLLAYSTISTIITVIATVVFRNIGLIDDISSVR